MKEGYTMIKTITLTINGQEKQVNIIDRYAPRFDIMDTCFRQEVAQYNGKTVYKEIDTEFYFMSE